MKWTPTMEAAALLGAGLHDRPQLGAAVDVLLDEAESLRAAIERVRELHRPSFDYDREGNKFIDGCSECDSDVYPCPTLDALNG